MNTDLSRPEWFKSSRSTSSGECVEAAHFTGGAVGIRDSKNPLGPALTFGPQQWDSFVIAVQTGTFDI
ncbi:MAG: hypothetical protein JWN03_4469 [Nocardia sp.]|uniref:DUF397 domain-containing protein n=1 Tax=Nocardia sp. TaxID=1821 RepID=UPI00261B85CB|nr:DUF397 domain-containing protein [Nocardia sp.]MCU1644194.1 hypothetical protein [Nocardia sp.]